MNYEETMAFGASEYADVLDALSAGGLVAEFIQTGGMNAAITVTLEAGHYLLITDREDTLSWERSTHDGWYVGLYPPDPSGQEPLRWQEAEESSVETLIRLVDEVLIPRAY